MKKSLGFFVRYGFKGMSRVRKNKHIISKFDDKIGIVYFGSVDQKSDDHEVIRGFTVSSTHVDNHYSVGSINGYDIALTNRTDVISQTNNSFVDYEWLVMSFKLHTKQDLPHIFIKSKQHNDKPYELLFDIFPVMQEVELGVFEEYSKDFTSRFTLFSQPTKSIEAERLLPATTARVLAAHFWPLSIEVADGVLYVYSDSNNIDMNLLDNMLKDGLWLADFLDVRAEVI